MDTRTFILYASVGTLVFSAASLQTALSPQGTASSLSGTGQTPPLPQSTCPPKGSTSFFENVAVEQLSAAYTPGDASSSINRSLGSLPLPVDVAPSTLWLARAIYSETKLSHEQELVAWVIRNRVETGYRGKSTYREVVLDPYQFSAFNSGSSRRSALMNLRPETSRPGWRQALWVAHYVRHAESVYRPFSIETRHFYSERSMNERRAPYWANESRYVFLDFHQYVVDENRFRFLRQIS